MRKDWTFASYEAAVIQAYEELSCLLKSVNLDPDKFTNTRSSHISANYLHAIEIKGCVEKAANKFGAYDQRGNWIVLHVLPCDIRIKFRDWEKRRRDKAIEALKELLEIKGYLEL